MAEESWEKIFHRSRLIVGNVWCEINDCTASSRLETEDCGQVIATLRKTEIFSFIQSNIAFGEKF